MPVLRLAGFRIAGLRIAVLLVALAPFAATAQPTRPPGEQAPVTRLGQSEQTRSNSTGYYYNHLPGEATIQVQVEGAVAYPGLYEVGVGTDLRRVLALAGGPRLDARDRDSDRRVDVQLLRPQEGAIYVSTLAAASVRPDLIPPLHHDDTILIDVVSKRRFTVQDAATIIGALGTFGFLIQAITR